MTTSFQSNISLLNGQFFSFRPLFHHIIYNQDATKVFALSSSDLVEIFSTLVEVLNNLSVCEDYANCYVLIVLSMQQQQIKNLRRLFYMHQAFGLVVQPLLLTLTPKGHGFDPQLKQNQFNFHFKTLFLLAMESRDSISLHDYAKLLLAPTTSNFHS